MRRLATLLLATTMMITACSGSDSGREDPAGFIAFGESAAPGGCSPDDVGRLVVGFLASFNSGNVADQLDQFIAPAQRFSWFSVNGDAERLETDAFDRASLGPHLQDRFAAGVRMRLLVMDTEFDSVRNVTHISYNIETTFPGRTETVVGKGAIDCETGTITVWSMGTSDGGAFSLCPQINSTSSLPIVCVREQPK